MSEFYYSRSAFEMRVTFFRSTCRRLRRHTLSPIHFATVFIFYCQSALKRNSSTFTIQEFREDSATIVHRRPKLAWHHFSLEICVQEETKGHSVSIVFYL